MDNNETRYTLPEGWIWTTIPELFVIIGGGTPAKNNISFWNGDINWASVKDIKSKYLKETIDKISKEGLEYSNTNIANKGDLVLVTRISPGQVAIVKEPTAVNQDLKILKIFGSMPYEYVYYLLCNYKNKFIKHSSGTTVKGLKISDLKNIQLPLPPLPEQHRIVSKIEELFSELDHAEEGLKKAQKQLEVYRQALLKSAFEGKMTEKWRKDNNSLKKNNWLKATIGEYSKFIGSGSTPKGGRNVYSNKGIPFIRSLNIHTNYFSKDDLAYISEEIHEKMSRTHTQPNDVLLTITGASIGRCAYIPESLRIGNVNQHVCIIRVRAKEVLYKYLTFYLNSPEAQIIINRINSGATREALTLSQIKDFVFPLCSMIEQDQIVQELESKFTLIENLENSILLSYQRINTFRQAILKKAFEGKLIPHFSHDESAQELLKRIQIEKEIYLIEKKTLESQKPKKEKMMEAEKSIIEILQESSNPVLARDLWLQSKHKDNIEEFYSELKEIYNQIKEVRKDTQSLISLKI